jgi:protein-S-isoprenylcysteine O-methyltransferase Ste14
MLLSAEQILWRHSFAICRLALKAAAVALICFVASQLVTYPARFYELHEFLECVGVMMMLVCIAGTAWCSLYCTDGAEAIGPYSLCRNPVSVFCAIGLVGAGAQIGHVSILLATGALAGLFVFLRDIEEEKRLRAKHGDKFVRYARQVPRFLPRFSNWRPGSRHSVFDLRLSALWPVILLVSIPAAEFGERFEIAASVAHWIATP